MAKDRRGFNLKIWLKKKLSNNSTSQTLPEADSDPILEDPPLGGVLPGPPEVNNYKLRSSLSPHNNTNQLHTQNTHSSRESWRAVRLPTQLDGASTSDTTILRASQVACTLIVKYKEEPSYRIEGAIINYEEKSAYSELMEIAMDMLIKRTEQYKETLYLKVGRFRLIRHEPLQVVSRCIVESQGDWDEYLQWKILEFRGQSPKTPFHIEVEWEYSSLHIKQEPDKSYAETIGLAIEDKMKKNWENRKYIPMKDLEKIMTRDTISKLIREDESLFDHKFLTLNGGKKLDTEDFIENVWLWASHLLALFVYTEVKLICLYHMWLDGLKDKDLPLTENHCPDKAYRWKFDQAVINSGGFAAHTFEKSTDHLHLPSGVLVPILFNKEDPSHLLGQGSFGSVYVVHVDRDHQQFSAYEEETFALKIFYDLSAHTQTDVENESGTLARLAKARHANITTPLASWKQNGICYMLFRCASCNLRNYMKGPSPELTKTNLLALLKQMRGLADGLRVIHNLGPSDLEPVGVDEKVQKGKHRRSHTCFHHDLKPANILVTINPDSRDLLFSISDFGSARIGLILSGSREPSPFTKNLSPGDAIYSAPDAKTEGRTSRPYDLWSMGCILLELVSWMLGVEKHDVQTFADKRLEIPDAYSNQDQAFWFQYRANPNSDVRVGLKPAVVNQMNALKEACEERGVFRHLLRLIGKLLSILPSDRPEASKLWSDLDAIIVQAEQNLEDKMFYINNMPTKTRLAAPPSSAGDSDDLSRRPSIDGRAIVPKYGNSSTLPVPDAKANRRSTVASTHPVGGPQRPSNHNRHQSSPGAEVKSTLLAPLHLDTRLETSNLANGDEIPNTPQISLSDYTSDSAKEEALLHINHSEDTIPPIGSHNDSFLTRRQKSGSPDSEVLLSD